MKKIKKFLLTIAMTMIFSVSAFAASGFEFILNVPFGLSVGFESVDLGMLPGADGITQRKIEDASPGVGFDIGVAAQLGYMFQVKDGFGISVLGELGYSHDTISGTYSKIEGGDGNSINWSGIKAIYTLEQFQIGLLPKFNIGAFSIGIGGGVKIPISAKERVKIDSLGIDEKSKFKPADAVQGYIKLTFDYSLFFTDNLAMNFGLYLGYDTPLTATARDASYFTALFERVNVHDFNVGLQLGFRFGPKA
ncbi:PorT family protein [Brachyspira aalborgi]|uniref:PorT family protein n=1 Tax=Brachyspira aalborgi TaxID=29522 RepID=A0A5C8D597_9SPIR|nr:outer membrane beta-barrel protein [Brachyspira aalborgi]TXJ20585.1 PorT family protein [Brachyspira aalborgi]